MTVMDSGGNATQVDVDKANVEKTEAEAGTGKANEDGSFSGENLQKDSEIRLDGGKPMVISAADKERFIDSVVANSRFTKDYTLFGGKVSLTLRSLTLDEVNALSTWSVKCGTKDPAGMMSGKYRKYLAAATVAKLNGVDMPPLDQPLFETLGKDNAVQEPGWVGRSGYWDSVPFGLFSAIMDCISQFDLLYAAMCREASNSNFWSPDTH